MTIELDRKRNGYTHLTIGMPKGSAATRIMCALARSGRIDVEAPLAVYDEVVLTEKDPLDQARHLAARLAEPVCLTPARMDVSRSILEPAAQHAYLHFGAHNQ